MKHIINHPEHGKIKMSQMQYNFLSGLDSDDAETYVKSFVGARVTGLRDYRYRRMQHRLSPVQFFKSMKNDYSDGEQHRPPYHTKSSQWTGVEIECFIDGVCGESCTDCTDGRVTCSCCEGDAVVTLYDNHDNEYSVSCAQCCGDGDYVCEECNGDDNSRYDQFCDDLLVENITLCTLKYDGSLGNSGIEITLLFDAQFGYGKLEKLCKLLNKYNATVTHQCGLHVHIDKANHGEFSLEAWDLLAKKLSGFIPESRRENTYCKIQASENERYSAINLCNTGTIEYRLHTGSTNFQKIRNWCMLLNTIKLYSNDATHDSFKQLVGSNRDMYRVLGLPIHIRAYLNKRYNEFNNIDNDDSEISEIGA